ncbi:MAG: hypothetical protein KGD67_11520 [Candidatus Lokiarchaeota archaeon]|nr:hypothetical protein [Candidatus Lokiarchaeota archaeon]
MKEKQERKRVIDSFIEMSNNDNYKEIFDNLLDSENDLELKTHIVNPMATTLLMFYSHSLKVFGYQEPSDLVDFLMNTYFKHMLSYKRLSRTEILNAISYQFELQENEYSLKEKLKKNVNKL